MTKSDTITKEKIANHLHGKLGLSAFLCEEITEKIFMEIFNLTRDSGKLSLPNFGTWKIREKEPRVGFNMKTRESVKIDRKKVLRFIPARSFRAEINR